MRRSKKRKEKTTLIEKIKYINNLIVGELNVTDFRHNSTARRVINFVRMFIAATNKFFVDDCLTKASAIAYTMLVSLIPTLTVILTFFASGIGNDQRDVLFREMKKFLADHNLQKLNVDPLIDAISGIIDNAASIGGIGAVVMVFSATAVLRTLDKSLNSIWNINKQRSIVTQIIYYWSVLTLGPLLFIAGTTLATQISSTLSYPNNNSFSISENGDIWLAGSKARLTHISRDGKTLAVVPSSSVDFDNQKTYSFNQSTIQLEESEEALNQIEFAKSEFFDIQMMKNKGWAVGANGLLLTSSDSGNSWHIIKLGNLSLNDIHMFDEKRGIIAANSGYVIQTSDGWESSTVKAWPDFNSNLNAIVFKGKNGFIACDRGYLLTSKDNGESWAISLVAKTKASGKNRFSDINCVGISQGSTMYLAGDDGLILTSQDAGENWISKSFKAYAYTSILPLNDSEAFIAGENGIFLYTNDGGSTWTKRKINNSDVNSIAMENGRLWAAGNSGVLAWSDNYGEKWIGHKGTSIIIYALNFFGPFVFIWLLFLFTYKIIPNVSVPFKPAAIGAAFTGTVFVAFIYLFIIYAKAFANSTFAVYGALAAIPLFLLMMYSSAVILLFGAEVSYVLMNPESYQNVRLIRKQDNKVKVYNGVKIIYIIYKNFAKGYGSSIFKDIAKQAGIASSDVTDYLEVFIRAKLVIQTGSNMYAPANSAGNIRLSDVIAIIYDANLAVPEGGSYSELNGYLRKKFESFRKSRDQIFGKDTIEDLISI